MEPPDVKGVEHIQINQMRQYVKGWITEWDLKRKYPDYQPRIETEELKQDYSEDPNLQISSEGDTEE